MKKIVAVHLLNDFSGSPLVLSQVLNGFSDKGIEVDVFTSGGQQQGFLNDVKKANMRYFSYTWSPNKWITLIRLLISQTILFFKLLAYRNDDVVIYVNTILPFGAALAGKMMGKKVIYHVHETSIKPIIFKRFLKAIASLCATEAIYVSNYLMVTEKLRFVKNHVVYNALSEDFISKSIASRQINKNTSEFNVLMLCSLKSYKGVYDFIELAKMLPAVTFNLVLNANEDMIKKEFADLDLPANFNWFPVTRNVQEHYKKSSLVLNLSHPSAWVETFGMTILEAMNFGIPVIVPKVGGITELVDDGVNGYKVNVTEKQTLAFIINSLKKQQHVYRKLCDGALEKAASFSIQNQMKAINSII